MTAQAKADVISDLPGEDNEFSQTAESTHKGVKHRSKYVTQVQQQRPESPTVTHLACALQLAPPPPPTPCQSASFPRSHNFCISIETRCNVTCTKQHQPAHTQVKHSPSFQTNAFVRTSSANRTGSRRKSQKY